MAQHLQGREEVTRRGSQRNQRGRPHVKHDLLAVGVGVFQGAADKSDWPAAVAQAVQQIRQQVSRTTLPPRFVLLYASPDWCRKEHPLGTLVRTSLTEAFGGPRLPLIGSSTPGILVLIPSEQRAKCHRVEDGFVVVVLFSDDVRANIVSVRQPYKLDATGRKAALQRAAVDIARFRKTNVGLGTSAAADLFAVFPGPHLTEDGTRVYLDQELHQDVLLAFHDLYTLFGGSSANSLDRPTAGYQFHNDECLETSLVIAMIEHDFRTGAAMAHGLKPIPGLEAVVTELEGGVNYGNRLVSINGKPAAEALRELMSDKRCNNPRPTLGLGGGDNSHIVVPIETHDHWGRSVLLNRRVYKGYRLTVLGATTAGLLHTASEVSRWAWERAGANGETIRLIFGQSCIGRYARYDTEKPSSWWEAATHVADAMEGSAPRVIALVAGEFGEDHRRRPRGDNYSVWAACMTAEPSHRALNRLLQRDLLVAGSRVVRAARPRHVMTVAIEEAIKIGAWGGQICVADAKVRKILGGRHGYASPRNVRRVLNVTFRELRRDREVFALNPTLLAWSVPLGSRRPTNSPLPLLPDTDILTIACANHRVFFVPDTQDPEFHCERQAARLAGIKSMLVLPLVGSRGRVLGTLQLTFDLPSMNEEQMRLWAGYGQKVALALERALEMTAKSAIGALAKAESAILQKPAPAQVVDLEDVQEYIATLQLLVGADYVHARVLCSGEPERFALVTTTGELAESHRATRSTIARNEGSMRNALDSYMQGGVFTLTKAATTDYYAAQRRRRREAQSDWKPAVARFATIGSVLIGTPERPLGCIVVHHDGDYFFTGPRRDVIRVAASKLGAILMKREADFRLGTIVKLENQLWEMAFDRTNAQHEVMRPITNIQPLLELLRRELTEGREPSGRIDEVEGEVKRALRILTRPAYTAGESGEAQKADIVLAELCAAHEIRYEMATDSPSIVATGAIQLTRFLESALLNLLLNAKDALAAIKSGDPVAITIRPDSRNMRVRITIENNGIEVTDEDVKKMFLPNYSTKTNGAHRGWGLPLAALIIFKQGGTLELSRRSGGGVMAHVTLPQAGQVGGSATEG